MRDIAEHTRNVPRIFKPRSFARLPRVVVIIPALNEAEKIGDVIRIVKDLYSDPSDCGFRVKVVVVDDGSTDKTAEVATEAGADRIVSHPRNLGLGAATRSGIIEARNLHADVALKLDADLQHDPADIAKVVQPIIDKQADIVYGSRFAGEVRYKMPFIRRTGNRFFTWLMRYLTRRMRSSGNTTRTNCLAGQRNIASGCSGGRKTRRPSTARYQRLRTVAGRQR